MLLVLLQAPYLFILLLAAANHGENSSLNSRQSSRWRHRTSKRRQRTNELLDSIEKDGLQLPSNIMTSYVSEGVNVPILPIPPSYRIDWDGIDPLLDPMKGGKIRMTDRGNRKRAQVEAFHYVISCIVKAKIQARGANDFHGITILDAGCGAGNLAVALAGLLSKSEHISVLALDVNEQALLRLKERAQLILSSRLTNLETCCADLADYEYIQSQIPTDHSVIVVSLHACGAASDMAMNLAFRCNAPFVICPCCTAKSLTKRKESKERHNFDPAASFQRSGASRDITYPRSNWLKSKLLKSTLEISTDEQYNMLAKVADVGLGPQTPTQQRSAQHRAKKVVEIDRLLSASENEEYYVDLMILPDHDPLVYGKGDLLLGAKEGSEEAKAIRSLYDAP